MNDVIYDIHLMFDGARSNFTSGPQLSQLISAYQTRDTLRGIVDV